VRALGAILYVATFVALV